MAVSIHGNNGLVTTNGTAAAPSLAAPDTDTGFFFGTNLIKASTGGTERLHIQSDGKSTFSEDVRIVKTSGPLLELTTNTGAADATLRLSEGTTGSTTNGGGMYYSGADNNLYITCGTNSTTKRITIQRDDGKIGINETTPEEILDLGEANQQNLKFGQRGYLGQAYSTTATILGHSVKADTTNTVASQMMVTETNSGGGAPAAIRLVSGTIQFHTAGSGTANAVFDSEKLRITSAGQVQINTDGGSGALTLGASQDFRLYHDAGGPTIFTDTGNQGLKLQIKELNLTEYTGNTTRLRINSSGAVSVGNNASPDGKLHVYSSSAGTVTADADADELVLESSGNTGMSILSPGTGESSIYFGNPGTNGQKDAWIKYYHETHSTTANRRALTFRTSGGEKLRIDSHGCVRVGNTATQTTSGNTKRIALGAKGSIQGWVSGQLNGHIQMIDNYYWDGANNKAIEADHCAYLSLRSGTLRFGSTNSSQTAGQNVSGGINERFRIASDGKTSVGTAQTTHTLGVTGGSSSQLLVKGTEADIWMESTGPSGVWRILGSTGTSTHRFRIYDNTNGKEPFYIDGSSGTNTQHVHVNSGNLVLDADGTGIDFSASESSRVSTNGSIFDDYEEGIYIPTIVGSSGGSWTTANYRYMAYTKIGRMVQIQGYLQCDSESSPSGSLRIQLPFAVASLSHDAENAAITVSMRGHGGSSNLYNVCGAASGSILEIIAVSATGGHNWIDASEVGTSWNLRIGGCYTADT